MAAYRSASGAKKIKFSSCIDTYFSMTSGAIKGCKVANTFQSERFEMRFSSSATAGAAVIEGEKVDVKKRVFILAGVFSLWSFCCLNSKSSLGQPVLRT